MKADFVWEEDLTLITSGRRAWNLMSDCMIILWTSGYRSPEVPLHEWQGMKMMVFEAPVLKGSLAANWMAAMPSTDLSDGF